MLFLWTRKIHHWWTCPQFWGYLYGP